MTHRWYLECVRVVVLGLGMLSLFYVLHFLANQMPEGLSHSRIAEAYQRGNLIASTDYPMTTFGTRSLQSLVGQDQFSDCRMLLSVVAPTTRNLRDVIAPRRYGGHGKDNCQRLHDVVFGVGEPEDLTLLNTKYWHGTKAMMAIGLMISDVFVLTNGIKVATYFVYGLLALLAYSCSKQLLAVLGPFLILGFFYSGIPYYGGFAYSLPYLFVLLALLGLVALARDGGSKLVLGRYFFVVGMISSYLFLLDGHLLMLLPMAVVVLYYGDRRSSCLSSWVRVTARCIGMFAVGFVVSFAVNQIGKASLLGPSVFGRFIDQLAFRMSVPESNYATRLADAGMAFASPFSYGFREVGVSGNGVFVFVLVGVALLALCVSGLILARRWYVEWRIRLPVGVIVIGIAGLIVAARILFLLQHTNAHSLFIGRYMFVPMALCWMLLVAVVLALRNNGGAAWVGVPRIGARYRIGTTGR